MAEVNGRFGQLIIWSIMLATINEAMVWKPTTHKPPSTWIYCTWWLTKVFVKQRLLIKTEKLSMCVMLESFVPQPIILPTAWRKSTFRDDSHVALELAPRITVNAVAPGIMLPLAGYEQTDMYQLLRENSFSRIGSQKSLRECPSHPPSGFMTGSIIKIDGGENIVWKQVIMDKILISGLIATGIIGVKEPDAPQELLLDIELEYPLNKAGERSIEDSPAILM